MGNKAALRRPRIGRLAVTAWLLAAAGFAVPASAGTFKVNPVQIHLPTDRRAASLTITNSDAAPVSIRVQAFEWTQVDGIDRHAATDNVIASPPIFTIPPGKAQLVRLGLRNRDAARAYRVVFEEIPREKPDDATIQITLRLDLPLYVLTSKGATPDLRWRAWRDRSGELVIEGSNRGSLHSQVVELSASRNGRDQTLSKQMGVVLPGSARVWKVGDRPDLETGAPLLLKVRTPTGETQAQVVVESR